MRYPTNQDLTSIAATDIPSLPLSYEDALPLLRALNGKGPCFDDWKGGLGYEGVTYCSGPSEGNLTMTNDVVEDIRPIWWVQTCRPLSRVTKHSLCILCTSGRPGSQEHVRQDSRTS